MNKKNSFSINNFVNNKELNIMKAVLPLLPPDTQKFLAIYISIKELSDIFSLFEAINNGNLTANPSDNNNLDISKLFESIKKFLDPSEIEMYENLINLMNVMKMYNEMSSTFENGTNSDFNMDALKSMLTPEQNAIFESLNNS